jgi:hypothetical protein
VAFGDSSRSARTVEYGGVEWTVREGSARTLVPSTFARERRAYVFHFSASGARDITCVSVRPLAHCSDTWLHEMLAQKLRGRTMPR